MQPSHERPEHRPPAVPAEQIVAGLEAVARDYEARAAWFRARADRWRLSGEPTADAALAVVRTPVEAER